MGMKVCLDTNIFIAVKNKEPNFEFSEKIMDAIEDKQVEGVISTIVLAEVLVGFYQNDEKKEANRFLSSALLNYEIVPLNISNAQNAAKIRAKDKIKLPDAIINATVLETKSNFLISNDISLIKKSKIKILTPQQFYEEYLEENQDM